MKIKSIESIKDYGIFSNFQKKDTKDFGVTNIIFGWNYSGKTTLSRIFRSIERKNLHPDYNVGKFKLITDVNSEIKDADLTTNSLKIRVFNSDYIREKSHWEQLSNGIPPILIVGEENIKLQDQLTQLNREKEELSKKQNESYNKKSKMENDLNLSLTDEARKITNELSLGRNFDRTSLKSLVDDSNVASWELLEENFQNTKTTAQSINKLEPVSEIVPTIYDDILSNIQSLLRKSVIPSKTIIRLKQDDSIENWVRDGRSLHKGKKKCEFCQNDLPANLLSELDAHFSKDYEAFRKEVENYANSLENKKLPTHLKTKNDFYPEFHEEYQKQSKFLIEAINKYNITIDQLIEIVKNKLSKLSESQSLDKDIILDIDGLKVHFESINAIIRKNRQKTEDFDKLKKEAVETLKRYYAFQYRKSYNYAEKKEHIKNMEEEIKTIISEIKIKTTAIQKIESKILESIKSSEILNAFIKRYFGLNTPIEIKIINNRFHVYRSDTEAKNLSEGEKAAISFSYFLTRLKDKDTKETLNETIVYIDDPISSLDSNHLYNTYALITSCLKGKCGQLFISTHNFEFFNLLKDEFKSKNIKKCDYEGRKKNECRTNLYQIERDTTNAQLNNLDCLLCNFKSEYQYLFYQLYQFYIGTNSADDYKLYTLPNLLRRFLETYLGFNYPSSKGLSRSLENLIFKEEERKLVHKIVDELSHNENTERVLKLYTTEEIRNAIKITFASFEQDSVKKVYLAELKKSVGI